MPTKAQHWEDGHKVNPVNETDGSRSEQIAATLYAWDATLGAYVRLSVDHPTGNLNVTGGGTGGGGAATIADGADVAQGTTSDSAWVSGSGTVISLLKKIASAGGSAVSVADGADVAQGTTTDLASANTVVGILKAIKAAVQGTLTVATHAVTQSGVWTVARSWTLSSATDSVNVGNFPATQPVSGTFFQATQPVSGTVAISTTPLHVDDNAGSLTVDAPVGTPVFVRLSDGAAALVGQKAMAASLPVVVASDQSAVPTKETPATLAVTATAATGVAATATLPAAGAGLFHYITHIGIELYATAARTGGATPILVTTTNLPGSPVWDFDTAEAIGAVIRLVLPFGTPLKASVANTATTIVAPIATTGIWRINVFYYAAA